MDLYNPIAGDQSEIGTTGSLRLVQRRIESSMKPARSVHSNMYNPSEDLVQSAGISQTAVIHAVLSASGAYCRTNVRLPPSSSTSVMKHTNFVDENIRIVTWFSVSTLSMHHTLQYLCGQLCGLYRDVALEFCPCGYFVFFRLTNLGQQLYNLGKSRESFRYVSRPLIRSLGYRLLTAQYRTGRV